MCVMPVVSKIIKDGNCNRTVESAAITLDLSMGRPKCDTTRPCIRQFRQRIRDSVWYLDDFPMMIKESLDVVGTDEVFTRRSFAGGPPLIMVRLDHFGGIVVIGAAIQREKELGVEGKIGPGFPTLKIGCQSTDDDRYINGVADCCGHANVREHKFLVTSVIHRLYKRNGGTH